MKRLLTAAFLSLPVTVLALPEPALPELQIATPPLTLVADALQGEPSLVNDFRPHSPKPAVHMSFPMLILDPGASADAKMVHAPDPTVDYKLTVKSPDSELPK